MRNHIQYYHDKELYFGQRGTMCITRPCRYFNRFVQNRLYIFPIIPKGRWRLLIIIVVSSIVIQLLRQFCSELGYILEQICCYYLTSCIMKHGWSTSVFVLTITYCLLKATVYHWCLTSLLSNAVFVRFFNISACYGLSAIYLSASSLLQR